MGKNNFPNINKVHTIIFDFDGVFTNNKVYLNENGSETIACDKSDSLGLDIFRNFLKINKLDIEMFVLSKEKNSVVSSRCKKLKLKCFNGVNNKLEFVKDYLLNKKKSNSKNLYEGIIYLGNDLNDYEIMQVAGFSVCPNDGNFMIKSIANIILNNNGGDGFVREFIEELISLNSLGKNELTSILK
tara:strand:+ start:97 stop:654 length:558 start_codon:yes stop_codon:yes gene_type:complete